MSMLTDTKQIPGRRRLMVVAVLLAVAGGTLALVLWWSFLPSLTPGPDMTGLQGVWREDQNPDHKYRFRKDGVLMSKSEKLPLGGLMFGEFGTWKRDGSKITVLPPRNWRMDGELAADGTIRGVMIALPEGNKLADVVWRRE